MKRVLLLGAVLCSTLSFSQSLDLSNEPTIGESQSMFLCDSFADTYPGITGTGVTWDYSTIAFHPGITRSVTIEDATLDPNFASFPTAVTTINVENTLTTFFHSDVNGRVSPGFVFTESTFGELLATFSADEETLVSFPFAYGSYLTDAYDGFLVYDFMGPQSDAAAGNVYAWIDGQGTLIQADGSSISNVIRYKLIDTIFTNVAPFGPLEVIRNQYEYYDIGTSSLPLLTFSRIVIQQVGGGAVISDNSIVLSVALPTEIVGLSESNAVNFTVYPNPTQDKLKLQGEFDEDATAAIYDQSGRLLMSLPVTNGMSIDLSAFNTGMYMLKVTNNGSVTTKTVVKK